MPDEVVTLKVTLDAAKDIESRLRTMDSLMDSLRKNSNVKLTVDTSSFDKLINETKKYLSSVTEQVNQKLRLATTSQEILLAEKTLATEAARLAAAYETAETKARSLGQATGEVTSTPLQHQIDALTGVSNEFKSAAESAKYFIDVEKKIGSETGNRVDVRNDFGTNSIQDYITNVEKLENATVSATKSVKVGESTFQQFSVAAQKTNGDVNKFTYSIDTATGAVYKMDRGFSSLGQNAVSALNKTSSAAKEVGSEFGNMFKNMLLSHVINTLISTPITLLQSALDELKAVDTELVNIQKVMGATAGEMENLSEKAYEVGSSLGIAASDYLASVTKWAQAGYGSLSDELGELSVKTQKVGDVQEATANQFLLSVDAAYKYKGNISELTKVLDGANEISNNYATSVEKLAGGMGIVSSLAAQAGMEVQETMAAIGTITAVTQESGNSAARALRALILNIQGSTEIAIDEASGERWTEDEIKATAAALGDLNVATREYKDGVEQLRNPMDVIGELSEKYRKGLISEVQLQEVVSSLGGKVRSNQLQALISNYDMYEEMLDTYADSVGSADRELDIYLNSWEAKTNRLKNQWVELVASFQANDAIKGILDIANALMEVANTPVGNILVVAAAIATLNASFAGFAATTGGAAFLGKFKGFLTVFDDVGNATTKVGKLTAGFKGLGSAITTALGPIGIALTVLYTLVTVIDALTVSAEEQKEKVDALSAEYQDATTTLESLENQYKDNTDRLNELNSLKSSGDFTVNDQEELDLLNEQNFSLERQIILQEKLAEAKKRQLAEEANTALRKGFSETSDVNFLTGFFSSAYDQLFGGNSQALNDFFRQFSMNIAGALDGFEGQANYISGRLDDLNKQKEEFLSEHGSNQSTWSEEELKQFDKLENRIANADEMAIIFYNEMQGYIGNLTNEEDIAYWQEIADSLFAAIAPAMSLRSQIESLTSAMDSATHTEFNDVLTQMREDGEVTESEIQTLIDKFPVLNALLESGEYTLKDLAQYFSGAGGEAILFGDNVEDASNEIEQMEAAADALSDTLNELESALSTLDSAQDELSENGKLSIGTVDSLIQQFPELTGLLYEYLAGLVSEQELQEALSAQYNNTTNEYKKNIIEKMMSNKEFYKNTILTNTNIVSKLAELGITDLENYQTLEELKKEVNRRIQEQMTKNADKGKDDRKKIYGQEVEAFTVAQASMLTAQALSLDKMKSKSLTDLLNEKNGIGQGEYFEFGQQKPSTNSNGVVSDYWDDVMDILSSAIEIPSLSFDSSSGGGSSGKGTSSKSWYEEEIDRLKDLVSRTKDTNTLLEKEEKNSYQKRIVNIQAAQAEIHKTANQFRAKGLSDTSDEIKQLKLMYHDLADEVVSIYQEMHDDLMENNNDREWELNLFRKNRERADRSVEEIVADNEKIVAEYKAMQQEVADLAAYYRSMGYDETDDLIQDLSDAWWDYQEQLESVYDSLTKAFEDYISESDRQIRTLERTTGTAGQQIEIYTQRINEAKKALQALQSTNINGINNERIGSIQDQIYSDEDAISNIQDELWSELEAAVNKEFDKLQDEIDDAQDMLDKFNEAVEKLDEELQNKIEPLQEQIEEWQDRLEEVLEPIEEKLDDLNEQLEAERDALEALTDPLHKEIEGYYTVNPDGTIGEYVPGINDRLDDLNDQLDKENEKWNEQKEREEAALALQKKELALQEAIKNLEQAQLDLETAKNERTIYTLKDGVWGWRADEQAIQDAEDALEDAEQAKEDAEKELEDLKEQQAHDKIISNLEDQIKALEKQKELINKQIDAYEKESEARQDYIQDQIDYWEKEKEAQEEHYNDLIEANQKEIEAWEEYYEKRKEAYDDDIEFWGNKVKTLQEQYDAWAERWSDIQDSMTEDVRSIEEILSDIAKYGTPEMKAQVDNITDLLRDMGVALGDFNSSIDSGQAGGGGQNDQNIIDQMKQNAQKWWDATLRGDKETADYYDKLNYQLGTSIGAHRDHNGVWWDKYGNKLFDTPSSSGNASGGPASGGSSTGASGSGSGSTNSMVDANNQISQLRMNAMHASDSEKRSLFQEANRLAVSYGAVSIPYTSDPDDWKWYNRSGDWLFDQGGIARGKGMMVKGTDTPEMVLSPVLASDVLNPVKNEEFDRFVRDMGIMFGAAERYAQDTRMDPGRSTSNDNRNYSHQTFINGVEIGDSMLDRPLSEVLSLLGLHRNY